MSLDNVEIIRACYDDLNRLGEPNADRFAPTATFDASRFLGFSSYRGRDEFLAAWRPYRETFDQWQVTVDELVDGPGGRVFAATRERGRIKESSGEISNRFFHVWELSAGRIVAWTVFTERSSALKASGLPD